MIIAYDLLLPITNDICIKKKKKKEPFYLISDVINSPNLGKLLHSIGEETSKFYYYSIR